MRPPRFNIKYMLKATAFSLVGVFAYHYTNKFVENKWAKYAIYTTLLAMSIPAPAALEIVSQLFNKE